MIKVVLSQEAEAALCVAVAQGMNRSVAVTKSVEGILGQLVGEGRLSALASFRNADINKGKVTDDELVLADGGNLALSSDCRKALMILAEDKAVEVGEYISWLIVSASNPDSVKALKEELADV